MDKKVEISILLDIYGPLLTEKQLTLLDDYYNNDLSLSEIAENESITRQAVRDNLKKGENNLIDYESKLGLMKKTLRQEDVIERITKKLEKVVADKNDLESILKDLNSLM